MGASDSAYDRQGEQLDEEQRQAAGIGLHPVEIAARRGIGPMSPLAAEAWHGQAKPCVSCGQLVRRTASTCEFCGQDMRPEMLFKMQQHAGPWYVLEHVRPFPGVKLDRLIRQIRRGVLNPTTIVRGPTTFHQWRFAAETPGLSKYLGLCWRCQAEVSEDDRLCPVCRVHLDGMTDVFIEQARPGMAFPKADDDSESAEAMTLDGTSQRVRETPPADSRRDAQDPPVDPEKGVSQRIEPGQDLRQIGAAFASGDAIARRPGPKQPQRIAGIRVEWVIIGLVFLAIILLCMVVYLRSRAINPRRAPSSAEISQAQIFADDGA